MHIELCSERINRGSHDPGQRRKIMALPLTALQKKKVLETYNQVQSVRETSLLTKRSRNTVKSILDEYGIDKFVINQAMTASENKKKFKEMPVLNPESKWNPLQSEIYKRLKKIEPIGPLEPGCVDLITNITTLLTSMASELQLGDSTVATFKLDLLLSNYLEYRRLLQRAMTLELNESCLPIEKVSKAACSYRDCAHKSLSKVLELLTELEGKKSMKGNWIQTNINLSVENDRMKDVSGTVAHP